MATFNLHSCSDGTFLATPQDLSRMDLPQKTMISGDTLTAENVLKSAALGSTYVGMDAESCRFIDHEVATHLRNRS